MELIKQYSFRNLQNIVDNNLDYTEYLQLIKYMCEKSELIEITNYCSKHNLNDKTVRNRINSGKIPYLKISETVFIIEKLL